MKIPSAPSAAIRAAILCSLLLASCGQAGVSPIGEVARAPASFEGREVKLRGTASQLLKLPLSDAKGFRLKDASGEIVVWTSGPMPADGEELVVRGRVESAVILGGESFGLAVQEIERQPPGIKWPWQ
jgi:hypothetical protein